jgi:hypothetical protein
VIYIILTRDVYVINEGFTPYDLCAINLIMTTKELIRKEVEKLPESLQREVYDFARFLREKADAEFDGLLLSNSTLNKDWDTPEEDAAWASL